MLHGAGGLAHPVRRIVNVDHHAPLRIMRRRVSSTNMALSRLEAALRADPHDDAVVINHLDCDSVLACGVFSGRLEPDTAYGDAGIASDHTGEVRTPSRTYCRGSTLTGHGLGGQGPA